VPKRRRISNRKESMGKKLALMVAGAVLLLNITRLSAHHSFAAEFDAQKPVKFRGIVAKMEWINPDAWIHMDVKGPDGKVVSWIVEAGTPNTLFRRGFTKNSLAPGTEILVEGYEAKDGSNKANGRDVTFPDGRKLFLGSSGTGARTTTRDNRP
jgi:hypothetical protein